MATGTTQWMGGHQPAFAYRAGLVLVMMAMVLLPIAYAGFTALAGWSVYYFATHSFVAIWEWPVGYSRYGLLLKVLCSVTPLLAGGAITIAMVKPFLARRGRRMQALALQPEVEPRVYTLVHEVCALVGAPAPERIELNCELNASAGFAPGWRGFFGNRLILTLGLPLVAGLTESELAGVIAHEFGHFRQGAGMRAYAVIQRVNRWFARVVCGRDAWDEAIESAGHGEGTSIALMMGCVRAGVGLSRGLLWLLMVAGQAMSGLFSRQMEYDADRWEMRVAGSAGFERTLLRLASLGHVLEDIRRGMNKTWRSQLQLPDNLPVLVDYRANHLPAAQRQVIENMAGLRRTKWLDTHPSPADRVRRARQCAEPGLLTAEKPAAKLFENFDTLGRLVTLAHYEDDLNVPTSPEYLIPLEQLVRSAGAPPPPPAPLPVPKMKYDPTAFQKKSEGALPQP